MWFVRILETCCSEEGGTNGQVEHGGAVGMSLLAGGGARIAVCVALVGVRGPADRALSTSISKQYRFSYRFRFDNSLGISTRTISSLYHRQLKDRYYSVEKLMSARIAISLQYRCDIVGRFFFTDRNRLVSYYEWWCLQEEGLKYLLHEAPSGGAPIVQVTERPLDAVLAAHAQPAQRAFSMMTAFRTHSSASRGRRLIPPTNQKFPAASVGLPVEERGQVAGEGLAVRAVGVLALGGAPLQQHRRRPGGQPPGQAPRQRRGEDGRQRHVAAHRELRH